MGILLKGGKVIDLDPARVEAADLRVEGTCIAARGPDLPPTSGDQVVEMRGKLILPGLVSAHHRLHTVLMRGMPAPEKSASELERRWHFDQGLDLDAAQVCGLVGALEALQCGVTTVIDSHSSPWAIRGSLARLARGVEAVGLRAVLSYEVSERHGAVRREEALEENVGFAKAASGRLRALLGAHASSSLAADGLAGLRDAAAAAGVGVHLELAESPADEKLSVERYGQSAVARLVAAGLLTPQSVVAHAVHLAWPELAQVISSGAWLVHCPRSNMHAEAGYAPAAKFGARATLGTDVLVPDVWAEAQLAWLRAREAGQPTDVLRWLANGHRLASQCFGQTLGSLQPGALADLVILEDLGATPLTPESLVQGLVLGTGARAVESVMVDGVWRLQQRRPTSVRPEEVRQRARQTAQDVWARAQEHRAG